MKCENFRFVVAKHCPQYCRGVVHSIVVRCKTICENNASGSSFGFIYIFFFSLAIGKGFIITASNVTGLLLLRGMNESITTWDKNKSSMTRRYNFLQIGRAHNRNVTTRTAVTAVVGYRVTVGGQPVGASWFGCGQLSVCAVDCSLVWMLTGEMFSLQLDRRRSFVIIGTVSRSPPLSVTIVGTLWRGRNKIKKTRAHSRHAGSTIFCKKKQQVDEITAWTNRVLAQANESRRMNVYVVIHFIKQ